MRHTSGLLALGSFLAIASCAQMPPSTSPVATTATVSKYQLGRIACREYRYVDAAQCSTEAQAYYRGSYPGSPTETLTLVSTSPMVYSMKAKNENVEIRFAVVSLSDMMLYGDSINYYEINRIHGNSDEKDLRDAADEFKSNGGILRGAFQDDIAIGLKWPWRAILKRKKAPKLPVANNDEAYGILTNPPYPR